MALDAGALETGAVERTRVEDGVEEGVEEDDGAVERMTALVVGRRM